MLKISFCRAWIVRGLCVDCRVGLWGDCREERLSVRLSPRSDEGAEKRKGGRKAVGGKMCVDLCDEGRSGHDRRVLRRVDLREDGGRRRRWWPCEDFAGRICARIVGRICAIIAGRICARITRSPRRGRSREDLAGWMWEERRGRCAAAPTSPREEEGCFVGWLCADCREERPPPCVRIAGWILCEDCREEKAVAVRGFCREDLCEDCREDLCEGYSSISLWIAALRQIAQIITTISHPISIIYIRF